MKPFVKFTYEELIEFNNLDKSQDSYINPEPIELEMEIIKTLLHHYTSKVSTPEIEAKIQELLEREDKLSKDLDDAYNT